MRRHHPENERIKRQYFERLEHVKGMSDSGINQVAAAIAEFEQSTNFKDFRKFHIAQAMAFKDRLQGHRNAKTGKPLAKATVRSRLMALKAFTAWLSEQPHYRARIHYSDAEYFNQSGNDERIAKAVRARPVPTLEQIRRTVELMPMATIFDRRDRAVVAFGVVSGARDNAIASFSLKHIDPIARTVFQDAREVRTKFAKTFTSTYFPVDRVFDDIVADWISELRGLGFGEDDPLFPATEVKPGTDRLFVPVGLKQAHWKDAGAIRRIYRDAFERAGMPYFHPHSFRHTLARHGEKLCRTAEEWRAYSQNFGHSSPMTTFASYGEVTPDRQAEIMSELSSAHRDGLHNPGELSDSDMRRVMTVLAKVVVTERRNGAADDSGLSAV
jgi:integrase